MREGMILRDEELIPSEANRVVANMAVAHPSTNTRSKTAIPAAILVIKILILMLTIVNPDFHKTVLVSNALMHLIPASNALQVAVIVMSVPHIPAIARVMDCLCVIVRE